MGGDLLQSFPLDLNFELPHFLEFSPSVATLQNLASDGFHHLPSANDDISVMPRSPAEPTSNDAVKSQ